MGLDAFLKKWSGKQGAGERAEYQQFLTELCRALDLPTPGDEGFAVEDYRFEAPVRSEAALGKKSVHRIDLYKRDCFILEAKQTLLQPGEADEDTSEQAPPETIYDLFGNPVGTAAPPGKRRHRYDRLMADARFQAERYALALPADHGTPPFLIVADIGRRFELYFDWAGNGRGYAPFPDERSYRIELADLGSAEPLPAVRLPAAEALRAVWLAPRSIDPRLKAAEVTRDVAERLSKVAARLETEERQRNPGAIELALGIEQTSLFLMRTLFCMFAEDVGLLPPDSFKTFLADAENRSPQFWLTGLNDLWRRMNDPQEVNRYWSQGDAVVRYFNGNLFAQVRVYDLPPEEKRELLIAAGKDWRAVEPAIFGTLLEQVLVAEDRAKLGAHYTPRAYVARLVEATMMDVLRPEWSAVREAARAEADAGDAAVAVERACAFHARLCAIRVLDPACGTGNFLYVAMEELLRLEGEVREFVAGLGEAPPPGVHPNQFLGLELNPRAAVIAELVLWIGWLRYRLANTPEAIGEPVLPPLSNVNGGTHGGFDAVLMRDAIGEPADPPRRPPWPEADFIVGNPPFIGGKDIRSRLGSDYAEALWAANPRVAKSADFVMQWWDRAADLLTRPGTRLKRFGFVTTNSITQAFSRRVIEQWLAKGEEGGPPPSPSGEGPGVGPVPETGRLGDSPHPNPSPEGEGLASPPAGLHLTFAIPDHPWTRVTRDAAAVRIAMTVAEAGSGAGRLLTVTGERALDTDQPEIATDERRGRINADLTVGTDVTRVVPLKANEGLCSPGVKLHGAGFIVTPARARELGLGRRPGLEQHIREYRNGRDLLNRPRGVMVIDLYGLSEKEVRDRFPEVYQHVLKEVRDSVDEQGKPNGRAVNRRETYKQNWWIFGEPRSELREAISNLTRFLATVETATHRVFQFFSPDTIADNKIILIAMEDTFTFGVLNSRIHVHWALNAGGWLGQGNDPVYVKSKVFDPFPFPDATPEQRARIGGLAEELDATRKAALAENPRLTMTGLYNLVEDVRSGAALPPAREAEAVRARARIVAKLHDDLDRAVAEAYGWPPGLPPAEIVARLVALNAERAAEEAAGTIRWLRPDYQIPRFARPRARD